MNKYIDTFSQQLLEAIEIGISIPEIKFNSPVSNIVVAGMGGSGIGGAIVKNFLSSRIKVPFEIIQDYTLPSYINDSSLVICSSYSGNTEETLSAFTHALDKKANILCITTGGELKELADINKLISFVIPEGHPPRTCLGYSIVALMFLFYRSGFIDDGFIEEIKLSAKAIAEAKPEIQNTAKIIADKINGTLPLIYSTPKLSATGTRIKQQLNENAKMFGFAQVIPEMNHNELVAFFKKDVRFSVIFLRDKQEPEQIKTRFNLSRELIEPKVHCILEIFAAGESLLEKTIYIIHTGDWISLYLSELNEVDPIKIEMLDWLKKELEK